MGRFVVDTPVISAKGGGQNITEVVWDPGYSLCKPESTSVPLAQAGIVQTFQPVTHQRGSRPFSGEALLIDGQLFSSAFARKIRHLPAPPRGAPEAEKIAYEAKFNQRARWRLVRHAGPDVDGVTRWRCPFCAGLLRSRQVTKTMRASRNSPLVRLPEGSKSCCSGILSAAPVSFSSGSTHSLWHDSMADLHGQAPGGRVGQRGAQGLLRRPDPRVLPGLRTGEGVRPTRIHSCGLQPRADPLVSGQARPR